MNDKYKMIASSIPDVSVILLKSYSCNFQSKLNMSPPKNYADWTCEVSPPARDGRKTPISIVTSPLRCIWELIARILCRRASEVRRQNWPPMARVAHLRHLGPDFDGDFTIEVHSGANS